mmetsp:Transcript_105675/g.303899  ORF Transcript_105675/g.303899 Transcript_105675/m.303899 type:complete len:255 (+) Transcript_105675:1071-1835(+)
MTLHQRVVAGHELQDRAMVAVRVVERQDVGVAEQSASAVRGRDHLRDVALRDLALGGSDVLLPIAHALAIDDGLAPCGRGAQIAALLRRVHFHAVAIATRQGHRRRGVAIAIQLADHRARRGCEDRRGGRRRRGRRRSRWCGGGRCRAAGRFGAVLTQARLGKVGAIGSAAVGAAAGRDARRCRAVRAHARDRRRAERPRIARALPGGRHRAIRLAAIGARRRRRQDRGRRRGRGRGCGRWRRRGCRRRVALGL